MSTRPCVISPGSSKDKVKSSLLFSFQTVVQAPLCQNLPDVPAQLLSLLESSIIKTFSPYLALKLQYNVHTPLCHLPRSLKGQRTRQGFYHKQTGVLAPRRYGQRLQESPGRSLHLFYFVSC